MALIDDKVYSEWVRMKKSLEKYGFETVEEFISGIDKLAVRKAQETLDAFSELIIANYVEDTEILASKVLEYINDFKEDLIF